MGMNWTWMGDVVHVDEDIVDEDVGRVIWRFLVDFFSFLFLLAL
jgi:translation initiation factor IF-1